MTSGGPDIQPIGGSARHCWLMRRDLKLLSAVSFWPGHISAEPFTLEFATEAHSLLMLAYSSDDVGSKSSDVPELSSWRAALTCDPECDPALCFTAWDDQGMVGFIQGWTSTFIKDLVVHPRARHQGIGLNLLNHAFTVFSQRGEAWVDLKVRENNFAARCLYEKAGMRYVQRLETDQS